MFITLIFVSVLGFAIIELPPGSYLEFEIQRLRQLGGDMAPDQIKALEIRYGVNDPIYVKFWKWFSGFVRGDFGESFEYHMEVKTILWSQLPFTVIVSALTMIVSWVVAIAIGVYSATHRYTVPDYAITVLQFLGLSIPSFLLALVVMVFAQQVLGMEVGGLYSSAYRNVPMSWAKFLDLLKHLWIPVIVIGASNTAWLSRVMRGNLLDVLGMQYVQTARAKGLVERRVIWKHAVRNALHPLVMVFGMSLPNIISGQTVVAIVLNLPIIGAIFFRALVQQDMYLAGTFLVFLAVMLVVGNLLADILLAWLDPRIQFE
jgi:peptide/nickel transport system permease protein